MALLPLKWEIDVDDLRKEAENVLINPTSSNREMRFSAVILTLLDEREEHQAKDLQPNCGA